MLSINSRNSITITFSESEIKRNKSVLEAFSFKDLGSAIDFLLEMAYKQNNLNFKIELNDQLHTVFPFPSYLAPPSQRVKNIMYKLADNDYEILKQFYNGEDGLSLFQDFEKDLTHEEKNVLHAMVIEKASQLGITGTVTMLTGKLNVYNSKT